ncbi:PH domain-containing protein [Streptomyces sp. NPDC051546]|uniref:PH domain-containing protein n=1 Tax=Streptomyces sp. NPDC051546 TaxID=3365655 RepID=UPI0037B9AEA5
MKGFAYAAIFLTIPAAVIIEAAGSTPVAYRTLASAAMACPFFVCLLWRFYFSPHLRAGTGGLVIRNPYRTASVPWSRIIEIGWQKSLTRHRLRILTSEGPIYPHAFGKVAWGARERAKFLADMEGARGADPDLMGNEIHHTRVNITPEIAVTIFFVTCFIVVLTSQ